MCRTNFGPFLQQMIDCLLYAKLATHLKRLIDSAYVKNGTYDQIVAQIKTELELTGLKTDGELQFPTMATTTTTTVNKQTQPQNTEQRQIILPRLQKTRTCHLKKPKMQW